MIRFKIKDAPARWNAERCSWPLKLSNFRKLSLPVRREWDPIIK
jgi:hypothetical protein